MLPDADPRGHRRHLIIALAANAASAAVKLAAFSVTGAAVLLSEGLHSVADCGNQAALLLGHRGASAAASAVHPLGRGRARYLWAFLVAVVVFGGGAVGAFADATYRLLNPEHHPQFGLTLAALAAAAVIEGVSLGSLLREARGARRGGETWIGFIVRSRDPDLPVLLVEDLADAVGLGLAIVAMLLAELTGVALLDAAASYLIGLLLAANAAFLAWEMASLLLGEAPDHDIEQAVLEAVGSDDASGHGTAVAAVHLGPDDLLIIVEVAAVDGGALAWLQRAGERAIAATPIRSRVVFDVSPGKPPTPDRADGSEQ